MRKEKQNKMGECKREKKKRRVILKIKRAERSKRAKRACCFSSGIRWSMERTGQKRKRKKQEEVHAKRKKKNRALSKKKKGDIGSRIADVDGSTFLFLFQIFFPRGGC